MYPTRLIGVAAICLVGCSTSSNPVDDPLPPPQQAAESTVTTFFVAGMNQKLQIL